MPTWGQYYWPIYLTGITFLFGIPELYALFTNTQNTLSRYAWRELDISLSVGRGMDTAAWWSSLILWLVFVVIITGHIWWRSI